MYGHGQSHQEVDSNTVLFSSNIARSHVVMFLQMVKKPTAFHNPIFYDTNLHYISIFQSYTKQEAYLVHKF